MNWEILFSMQNELDQRIKKEHTLNHKDLIPEKILALLVELGELANETRCFKFWSNKGPSEMKVILEEYVDGLHFIISLGLEINFDFTKLPSSYSDSPDSTLTTMFLKVYEKINILQSDISEQSYSNVVESFIQLGFSLGFNVEMIEQAYVNKNEVNHQRQTEGY